MKLQMIFRAPESGDEAVDVKDVQRHCFQAMKERTFYRPKDLACEAGVSTGQARYALRRLAAGGG